MYLLQALFQQFGQGHGIQRIENLLLQGIQARLLAKLAAAIEDGVALAPGGDQTHASKHLEVVAQRRLTGCKQGAQLGHTKGVVAQHAQDLQAQRVCTGLAQVGQGFDARFGTGVQRVGLSGRGEHGGGV